MEIVKDRIQLIEQFREALVTNRYEDAFPILSKLKEPVIFDESVGILCSVSSTYRFCLFLVIRDRVGFVTPVDEIKTFVYAYTGSDNILKQCHYFNNEVRINAWFDMHEFLSKHLPDRKHFMHDSEMEVYESLPEKVEIYRGASEREIKSNVYGVSWTLSEKIAEFYTTYHRNSSRRSIVKKHVPKNQIVAYLSDREEDEVLYLDVNSID